jgi:Ca-activated chloride channel family protein
MKEASPRPQGIISRRDDPKECQTMPAIPRERQGVLPKIAAPTPFPAGDSHRGGWRVQIPGGRPLATPAVAEGRIFLGGGFGSYEFYAFDARTGSLDWIYQTHDDGPTAAVVSEGFVVFNTESCELEVLTLTGRPVWKKWLGDPLMSIPAVADGRIVMAYPDTRGDRRHYLSSFRLDNGHELWKQPISGEIITAPTLADGHVYFATLDGTLSCARLSDGGLEWSEKRAATSSPVVWNGECFYSKYKEMEGTGSPDEGPDKHEQIASREARRRHAMEREYAATAAKADYLQYIKRLRRSPRRAMAEMHDAHVGFAAFKGDAKMHQAQANLGYGTVREVWAFQGSKPFLCNRRLYSSQGDFVQCVEPHTAEVHWKRKQSDTPDDAELLDHSLTPPATVNGKLFIGTLDGDVRCLSAGDGQTLWKAELGEPVIFQPAVAAGRVYAATERGSLVCIETGDPADDGWNMWGADSTHNGCP